MSNREDWLTVKLNEAEVEIKRLEALLDACGIAALRDYEDVYELQCVIGEISAGV